MESDKIFEIFLDTLNEAVAADPAAILNLCETRVKCNNALADHPTIVVQDDLKGTAVGLLGILNGICVRLTGDAVAAEYNDQDELIGFVKYVGK